MSIIPDVVVSSSHTDPNNLRPVLDEAYSVPVEDTDWRVFRGPYPPGSSTPSIMAWRARTGRSYVDIIDGRDFEFRAWTDPETEERFLLVRRASRGGAE